MTMNAVDNLFQLSIHVCDNNDEGLGKIFFLRFGKAKCNKKKICFPPLSRSFSPHFDVPPPCISDVPGTFGTFLDPKKTGHGTCPTLYILTLSKRPKNIFESVARLRCVVTILDFTISHAIFHAFWHVSSVLRN